MKHLVISCIAILLTGEIGMAQTPTQKVLSTPPFDRLAAEIESVRYDAMNRTDLSDSTHRAIYAELLTRAFNEATFKSLFRVFIDKYSPDSLESLVNYCNQSEFRTIDSISSIMLPDEDSLIGYLTSISSNDEKIQLLRQLDSLCGTSEFGIGMIRMSSYLSQLARARAKMDGKHLSKQKMLEILNSVEKQTTHISKYILSATVYQWRNASDEQIKAAIRFLDSPWNALGKRLRNRLTAEAYFFAMRIIDLTEFPQK